MCFNKILFTKIKQAEFGPQAIVADSCSILFYIWCCANHKYRMPKYVHLEQAFSSTMSLWAHLLASLSSLICNVKVSGLGEC